MKKKVTIEIWSDDGQSNRLAVVLSFESPTPNLGSMQVTNLIEHWLKEKCVEHEVHYPCGRFDT